MMSMLPNHTEFTITAALLDAALDAEWDCRLEEPYFANPAAGFILAVPLGLCFWVMVWLSLGIW